MQTIRLWNNNKVKVREVDSEGNDFYFCYDLKDNPIDVCRTCGQLAYREELEGNIDNWLCPQCQE
jgi:formamidopyrimidine-DNA glycosylase